MSTINDFDFNFSSIPQHLRIPIRNIERIKLRLIKTSFAILFNEVCIENNNNKFDLYSAFHVNNLKAKNSV